MEAAPLLPTRTPLPAMVCELELLSACPYCVIFMLIQLAIIFVTLQVGLHHGSCAGHSRAGPLQPGLCGQCWHLVSL